MSPFSFHSISFPPFFLGEKEACHEQCTRLSVFGLWIAQLWPLLLSRSHDSKERRTRDRKVASSNPGSWPLLCVHSSPALPQRHVKDPGHFAKSAGGRWHLNTRIQPWPNEVGVGWLCCPGIVLEPIGETSSHATRQGTLGHSRLSSLTHCRLVLA